MPNYRVLAVLVAAFLLAVGIAASTGEPSFNTRWADAIQALATASPSSIPEDTLRAHGEKVLRERLIAKDDEGK